MSLRTEMDARTGSTFMARCWLGSMHTNRRGRIVWHDSDSA